MAEPLQANVVIVGAGVAGRLAAYKLAQARAKVIVLEAGPPVDRVEALATYRYAVAKTPESPYPDTFYAPRPTVLDPHGYYVQEGPVLFKSTYERRVGGATWHWLGTALRHLPNDFRLRSRCGIAVDWPISYEQLEPWYSLAEQELGVAGDSKVDLGSPRSQDYRPGLCPGCSCHRDAQDPADVAQRCSEARKRITMQKQLVQSLSILLALLAIAGCAFPTPPAAMSPPTVTPDATEAMTLPAGLPIGLENTHWQLISFGPSGSEMPVSAGTPITLMFTADGQASGEGGCNSFGGSYQVQDDSLIFGELVSTLMACVDESLMQQEQLYLQALQSAGRFALAADQLTIWYDEGTSQLNFAPFSATTVTPEPPTAGNQPDEGTATMAEYVEFEPGATAATRSGTLPAGGRKEYALTASAGQTMHVQTVGYSAPVSFTLHGPDGTTWSGEPQASDVYIFTIEVTVPENGDYRVTLAVPADAAKTRYDVTFTIDTTASQPMTPGARP